MACSTPVGVGDRAARCGSRRQFDRVGTRAVRATGRKGQPGGERKDGQDDVGDWGVGTSLVWSLAALFWFLLVGGVGVTKCEQQLFLARSPATNRTHRDAEDVGGLFVTQSGQLREHERRPAIFVEQVQQFVDLRGHRRPGPSRRVRRGPC